MAAVHLDTNWTVTIDNKLVDFWSQHECLYNPLNSSYSDKELKSQLWSQLAVNLGKHVNDVEKRVRFLRAQYGRMLLKPLPEQPKYAAKRKTLRKLNFLKPFIQRKCTPYTRALDMEQKWEDEEEVENQEGEDNIDQERGSMYGSPIDYNISDSEPIDEPKSLDSTPNTAAMHQTPAQHLNGEILPPDINSQNVHKEAPPAAGVQDNDNLDRFSQLTLTDMRQIKNPFILMRLRRDITNLVFQAVQDDLIHRRGRSVSLSTLNNGGYAGTRNRYNTGVAQPPLGPMVPGHFPPHSQRRKEHNDRQRRKWEEIQKKTAKESVSSQQGETQAEGGNETNTQTMTPQKLVIKTETDQYEIEIDSLILAQ